MMLNVEDIVIALSATVTWALALIINKSLSTSIGSLRMNTVRLWSGFTIVAAFVWIFGKCESTYSYPTLDLVFLVSSGIIALAVGDTVFIRSLYFIYVSQAFPVGQCVFLVLTVVSSILFLSETFTLLNILGGTLILAGLYLVSVFGYQSGIRSFRSTNRKGLLLALSAALAWTTGAVILKISLTELNAVFAAAIRTFSAASALTIFQYGPWIQKTTSTVKRTDLKKLSLIALSGILGYGIGGLAYVLAMQRIGAGRTVLITSLTPVLVLILSVLFLKEKPTRRSVIGTVVCVVGVMCLSV
jgi:uncharacterized membrane protein